MPTPQTQGAIKPWTKRDNFSVDRHNELVYAVNAASGFTAADGLEVIQSPTGRSVRVIRPVEGRWLVARVMSKTIPRNPPAGSSVSPGNATLSTGYYAGRIQTDNGLEIDPTQPVQLSTQYSDLNAEEDIYIENFGENLGAGTQLATDGTVYVIGQFYRYALGGDNIQPALPILRVAGIGGGSSTTGQYQYMLFQMVAQNVAGWDWGRMHPLI